MAAVSHRCRMVYFPIPKNGSSSVKRMFYEMDSGRSADSLKDELKLSPHDIYSHQSRERWLRYYSSYSTLVIVRDPIKRFLSSYSNRVVHRESLSKDDEVAARLKEKGLSTTPSLNEFVANLAAYRDTSDYIKKHTNPQARYVEEFWEKITHKIPIERIDELPRLMESMSGIALALPHLQTEGPKIEVSDLSEDSLAILRDFYGRDYKMLKEFYDPESLRRQT